MYTPTTKHEYDTSNLPDRINFLKATADLPLPRGAKAKFQVALSKMSKPKIKEQMGILEQIMHDKLIEAHIGFEKGHIVIPKKIFEVERRKLLQVAIFTKALHDFAEKYLTSLEYQKKI